MPGFVALPGVFQAWRNTLGAHIALVMSGTVIFFMALASGLGYLNAVQLAAQKHEQAMELQLVEHSREVRTILDGFATQLRSYSHSTVISSTLIDSEGRERHIRPFLELAGESLRQAFGAVQSPTPGAPVIGVPRVAVLDHRGTVLAQSTRTAENYQSASWLKTVMNGAPFAAVDGRELLVAYPILLPSTGLPEGIVVGRVDIGALFGTTAEVSIGGALWRAGVAAEMAHWAGAPDMLVRTHPPWAWLRRWTASACRLVWPFRAR